VTDGYELAAPGGTITVTPAALTHLVVQAAELADGARVRRPRRGLEIEVEGRRARVSLELASRYGVPLPDLARDVQARVAEALQTMCGLEPEAIDVTVEELDR
jgi:uncharacterized alkaline shock family protein YloU